ncbi:MAG TPA: glycosyltransferase family 4 protein [Anaerolineae bacterium]|nr:glycosyltransferase family 4 protein [Anaerolineae bacterium]HIQ09582.1 glycosyltransferase family 1 protein [Anaerolineaceae bacterium]
MKIIEMLTYYRPHVSGLTVYVERLSRALAARGHEVTVLTSQYDRALPREEVLDGVRVVRVPVLFRVSKGVIMPTIGLEATRQVLAHDVVHLHLPQFDAAGVAFRGRVFRRPTVLTYHCDVKLPPGAFNRVVNTVVHTMDHLAAIFAHQVVTYTQDYADHSPYLRRYRHKLTTVLPPVTLPRATSEAIAAFARQHNPQGRRPVIGMAARLAAEKGVEYLVAAMERILERYPEALVLYAGPYENVLGEEAYRRRVMPAIRKLAEVGHWRFVGLLSAEEMAAYYPNLDVLVLPSLNSTEGFGLVQIEAMMNGVPVVASNLPGVRQPVRMTSMGEIAQVGDAASLAQAILKVLEHPEAYRGDPEAVARRFAPEATAAAYEALFERLRGVLS